MHAIVAAILAVIARIISSGTIQYIAYRALILTALTIILPSVLYKVFGTILTEMTSYASTQVSGGGLPSITLQITGMGGWIGQQINLSASLSVILSAVSLRFVLNLLGK